MRSGLLVWLPLVLVLIMLMMASRNRTDHSPAHSPAMPPGGSLRFAASGICPQPRRTQEAPRSIRSRSNPLPASPSTLQAGKTLYHESARPTACRMCHGIRGNGNGRLAPGLEPAPRNFTCRETMQTISDGQMFWIIKHGSPGTAMPAHEATLSDRQIWQLIWYIRQFAN